MWLAFDPHPETTPARRGVHAASIVPTAMRREREIRWATARLVLIAALAVPALVAPAAASPGSMTKPRGAAVPLVRGGVGRSIVVQAPPDELRTSCPRSASTVRLAWAGRGPARRPDGACPSGRTTTPPLRPSGYRGGRPEPLPDPPPEPAARESRTSGISVVGQGSDREDGRRLSRSAPTLASTSAAQSLASVSRDAADSRAQVATRDAIFHEAHAPPIGS